MRDTRPRWRLLGASAAFESVDELVVLRGVEVAVAVEHDGDRRVAGERRHLLGIRAVRDPQRHCGVAEVVDPKR